MLQGVRVGVIAPGGCEGLEGRGLTCPVCGKAFSSRNRRQDLQRHLLSHTGERPFPCSFCPYRASLKGNLKKHIQGLHGHLIKRVENEAVSPSAPVLSPPSQNIQSMTHGNANFLSWRSVCYLGCSTVLGHFLFYFPLFHSFIMLSFIKAKKTCA